MPRDATAAARSPAAVWLSTGDLKDIDATLDKRLARQAILDRDDPPVLWALLAESLLELPCGGPTVMRAQLAHILALSERPGIGVRVVPKAVGHHPGLDGAFMLLTMPTPHSEIAFVEAPGGGRLVPNVTEVASYALRYDRIGQQALPPGQSRDLIRRIMEAM